MDVEAELALHGYADPSASLFRGCQICILSVPKSEAPSSLATTDNLFQSTMDVAKAAAATQVALQECQLKRVALQVFCLEP